MKAKLLGVFLTLLPLLSWSQNENFNTLKPFVDGSFIKVTTPAPLKVKIDERYTDYQMSLSQIKVYASEDNPISNFVTAISNQSSSGSEIKRGINLLELTLSTTVASGYYVLEIPDSKGESSYLRFYYDSGLSSP